MGLLALFAASVALLMMGRKQESKATAPSGASLPGPVIIDDKAPSERLLQEASEVAPNGIIVPAAEAPAEVKAAQEAIKAVASADWQTAVVSAALSGDAATLDVVAAAMTGAGLAGQAASVTALADSLRREAVAANLDEGIVVTQGEVAALAPPAPVPEPDPKLLAAKELATYVSTTAPWKENRETVKSYQTTLGLAADGKYGPGTASCLVSFGIIPPAPFYWPATGTSTSIANYRKTLQTKAVSDPPRAAEWLYAADHCVR